VEVGECSVSFAECNSAIPGRDDVIMQETTRK